MRRILFQPFLEQKLTAALAQGLAVRNGAIANALLPVAEERKLRNLVAVLIRECAQIPLVMWWQL